MKTLINTLLIVIFPIMLNAQNHLISLGVSIPNADVNQYLKSGYYLSYTAELSINKHLKCGLSLSVSRNGKNPNYRFGLDDDPFLIAHPNEKEFQEILWKDDYSINKHELKQYLINYSTKLQIKYLPFNFNTVNPYVVLGVSGNLSIYDNMYCIFDVGKDNKIKSRSYTSDNKEKIKLGYFAGGGISYKFKSKITIFAEFNYHLLPKLTFGRHKDKTALFIIHTGVGIPFRRQK